MERLVLVLSDYRLLLGTAILIAGLWKLPLQALDSNVKILQAVSPRI